MTDLEKFNSLDRKRRNAWRAFFAGALSSMMVFEGEEDRLFFGKAECEWVPSTFWTEELVELGWITYEDGEKRPALGMADLPEGRKPWCWERRFTVTDRGWALREADEADFRATMERLRKEMNK